VIREQSAFQSGFPEKDYVNIKRTQITLKKMFSTRKVFEGKVKKNSIKPTRAKSSYDTCDEARRAKNQEIIWYEL